MSDEHQEPAPRNRVGVVAADRTVGVYPARVEPVTYGRGTTLFVVLVLLVLFFLFFGIFWIFRQ